MGSFERSSNNDDMIQKLTTVSNSEEKNGSRSFLYINIFGKKDSPLQLAMYMLWFFPPAQIYLAHYWKRCMSSLGVQQVVTWIQRRQSCARRKLKRASKERQRPLSVQQRQLSIWSWRRGTLRKMSQGWHWQLHKLAAQLEASRKGRLAQETPASLRKSSLWMSDGNSGAAADSEVDKEWNWFFRQSN